MIILYVNNYRGFQDTYIPLTDVNFLVGENSSGKTSILSLLQVLSSEAFWRRQEFGLENLNLAFFQEVISAGSKDNFFEVALMDTEKSSKHYPISAFYLKFMEKDGKVVISDCKFLIENYNLSLFTSTFNTTNFAIKNIDEKIETVENFKIWLKNGYDHTILLNSFIKVSLQENSLGFILSMIIDGINELPNKKSYIVGLPEPNILQDLTPIAPIRAKPQRYYEGYKVSFTTEGDHIPYLLKSIMESANHSDIKKNVEIFGDNSGLFEKLQIKKLGDDNIAPFEIHISLNGNVMKLTNVGYGVSQILPVLVEILSKKDGTWFAIQQPEVHLHPKAQAALGELFFNIAKAENKSFLIETHSDYLIDRYRLALRRANKKLEKPTSNAQVLFFERTTEGNKIHILPIDERGDYPEEQPEGFRDFFINEELNLLTY